MLAVSRLKSKKSFRGSAESREAFHLKIPTGFIPVETGLKAKSRAHSRPSHQKDKFEFPKTKR